MNNNQLDNRAAVSSQFYPGLAHDAKQRTWRRGRRKNKGGQNGISGTKKRKLSQEQVILLERNFGDEHKLESQRKERLAAELGLDPRQVAVWFQNRRARYKSKKLEEEYSRLRAAHEDTVVEKCRLEAELLKLKYRLVEAKKEIRLLSARLDSRGRSDSPISSMDVMEQLQFPGDYVYDDIFFVPEAGYINGFLEWGNLYL